MKNNIAPAADEDINISELIKKFCDEDFYADDYEKTTKNLISDDISYEDVKAFIQDFTKDLF
jgi:hypothetical protein